MCAGLVAKRVRTEAGNRVENSITKIEFFGHPERAMIVLFAVAMPVLALGFVWFMLRMEKSSTRL